MIARPHICLKFRLRLAKRSTPQVRFQSADARLPVSEPRAQSQDPNNHERSAPVRRPVRLRLSRRPLGPPKPAVSEHPLGKLYGYLGHKLRENTEKLQVDALGQPAEVIVLRDSKFNYYNAENIIEAQEAERIDILERVNSERGLIGQQEVEANINEFKPKEGEEPQTWDEFNGLVQALQNGFTVSQLEKYIVNYGGEKRKEPDSPSINNQALILRRSPWMPDFAKSADEFDNDSLRGYYLESHTTKQRVVVRLLRDCWKLQLPELEEGIGQVEAHIRSGDLDLLLKGSQSLLSEISASHIAGELEKIEAFRSRGVIRITTAKPKADLIIQDIEQALKRIRRMRIALFDLVPPLENPKVGDTRFDDQTLQKLSRLTNTDIVRQAQKNLVISCVDNKADSLTSNRSDVARRLLLTSDNFSSRVAHWLGCKDVPDAMTGAFIKYPNTEGLGWCETLRQWTRWTVPIQKSAEYQIKPLDPTELRELVLQRPSAIQECEDVEPLTSVEKGVDEPLGADSSKSQGSMYWSDKYFTSSSTLVGSVLHSHCNEKSARAKKLLIDSRDEVLHAFSTRVPNVTQLLASATILRSKPESTSDTQPTFVRPKPVESLVLKFLPNPLQTSVSGSRAVGPAALDVFPAVEMRFDIDPDTREAKLRETLAVIQEDKTDLMLPDQAVDLRFLQKTTSRLRRKYLPQIKQFLDKSNLTLAGGQLETPAKVMLPISSHLCRDHGFQLLLGKEGNKQEITEVEYLFASLEIRNTIALDFEGWRLLYTSIEAGKAGGRRSELILRPITTLTHEKKGTVKDFIAAGYELAERLTNPQTFITRKKTDVGRDTRVNRFVRLGLRKEHKGMEFTYLAKRLGIRTVPVRSDEEKARAWGNGLDNALLNEKESELGYEQLEDGEAEDDRFV